MNIADIACIRTPATSFIDSLVAPVRILLTLLILRFILTIAIMISTRLTTLLGNMVILMSIRRLGCLSLYMIVRPWLHVIHTIVRIVVPVPQIAETAVFLALAGALLETSLQERHSIRYNSIMEEL